jgi:hypothetical protein
VNTGESATESLRGHQKARYRVSVLATKRRSREVPRTWPLRISANILGDQMA